MIPKFEIASIGTAFDEETIGTKVVKPEAFWNDLREEIKNHEFHHTGVAIVPLSRKDHVVSGVARREGLLTPNHYVVKFYRGRMRLFAQRKYAHPHDSVAAVVYTKEAYLTNKDVKDNPQELERISKSDCQYVLVAVLAAAGPRPPVSPETFVHNLAGHNKQYTPESGYTLEKAIQEAKAVDEYDHNWITVSD